MKGANPRADCDSVSAILPFSLVLSPRGAVAPLARVVARGPKRGRAARVTPVALGVQTGDPRQTGSGGRSVGRKPTLARTVGPARYSPRHGPLARFRPISGRSADCHGLERLTGVRHHPAHVWRLLQKLNWSLQRPARKPANGRAGDRRWRRERWPQVKNARRRHAWLFETKAALAAPGRPPHLAPRPDARPDAHAQRLAARVGRGRPGLRWTAGGSGCTSKPARPRIAPGRRRLPPPRVATSVARGDPARMACLRTGPSCSGISAHRSCSRRTTARLRPRAQSRRSPLHVKQSAPTCRARSPPSSHFIAVRASTTPSPSASCRTLSL